MVGLLQAVRDAKRVYIIGNGGSYANAMHIQNDLLSCGVAAFTMDPSTLTAFANDYGYDVSFAKWLNVVATKDDLLIALSGSGKSPNILKACEAAEAIGMAVYKEFGSARGLNMQHAEEMQLLIGHDIMREIRGR